MSFTPYLFFQDGKCRAAMEAYAKILGAEIVAMMPASDMPGGEGEVPPEKADWVMHGALKLGDGFLYASDDLMGGSAAMAGASVMVDRPDEADGRRVFEALAEGGEVQMAWQKTFWSEGFGTLTDRWGTKWMVGVAAPEGS